MNYSVNKLKTVNECDSLLSDAAKEKKDLGFRKTSSEKSMEDKSDLTGDLIVELAIAQAEYSNYVANIATIPEGPSKRKHELLLQKAKVKLMSLQKKEEENGPKAILKLEADIARLQKEIEELTAFMTEVETRKAAI